MYSVGCGLTVMNISQCPRFDGNITGVSNSNTSINVQRLVELYLIGLMCLVGLFGNVVTIVVLRRDKERREAVFLLQALAVADGLYLLVAIPRYPLKYILPVYRTYIVMQPVVFPMLKTCQTITIWTMVLVTIDRYIYVCHPLHALQLLRRETRRKASVGIAFLGIIFNFPRFFESCIVEWFNPCNNTTLSRSLTRPEFNHPLYYDIYQQGAYIVVLYIIPLAILTYMNSRLIQAIYQSRRRHRHSTTSPDYKENNATVVLVIIVLVFTICETPELFLRVITFVERKFNNVMFTHEFSKGLVKFNIVSQLLKVINSSVNFFIYFIFGRRFRSIMKEAFTVKCSTSAIHVAHEDIPLNANPSNLITDNVI